MNDLPFLTALPLAALMALRAAARTSLDGGDADEDLPFRGGE